MGIRPGSPQYVAAANEFIQLLDRRSLAALAFRRLNGSFDGFLYISFIGLCGFKSKTHFFEI